MGWVTAAGKFPMEEQIPFSQRQLGSFRRKQSLEEEEDPCEFQERKIHRLRDTVYKGPQSHGIAYA